MSVEAFKIPAKVKLRIPVNGSSQEFIISEEEANGLIEALLVMFPRVAKAPVVVPTVPSDKGKMPWWDPPCPPRNPGAPVRSPVWCAADGDPVLLGGKPVTVARESTFTGGV